MTLAQCYVWSGTPLKAGRAPPRRIYRLPPLLPTSPTLDDRMIPMDFANSASWYALRYPPAKGAKPMKFKDIRKLVRKNDGRLPTMLTDL